MSIFKSLSSITYKLNGQIKSIDSTNLITCLKKHEYTCSIDFFIELLKFEGINLSPYDIMVFIKSNGCYLDLNTDRLSEYYNELITYETLNMVLIPKTSEYSTVLLINEMKNLIFDELKLQIERDIRRDIMNEVKNEVGMSIRKEIEAVMSNKIQELTQTVKNVENKFVIEVEDLKKQIADLDKKYIKGKKLTNVSQKLPSENKLADAISLKSGSPSSSSSIIDLAVMFAEPLIYKDPLTKLEIGLTPVSYEDECSKILETLRKKNKKIEIEFEVANYDNLLMIINKGVTALHISCHGEYCKERKDFYLAFEKKSGELHKVFSQDLKNLFNQKKANLQLVFVNACHSEMIGNVFKEAGVPCVIAINSTQKINDIVAQYFSEVFYDRLFSGYTIKGAFSDAKESTKAFFDESVIYSCCCSHKHTNTCPWFRKSMELHNSSQLAHFMHLPRCNCKNRNKNIHDKNCLWYFDFCQNYQDEDLMFTKIEEHSCCCTDDPCHNELEKFKIICLEEDLVLFSKKPDGRIWDKYAFKAIDRKFKIQKVHGLNQVIYEVYNHLVNKEWRIIELTGQPGIGKSILVKQFANYAFERDCFDDICFIDISKIQSNQRFIAQICAKFSPSYDLKSLFKIIKPLNILFILDNCENLNHKKMQVDKPKFNNTIEKIIDEIRGARFLFVSSSSLKDFLTSNIKTIHMRELEKSIAAQMLYERASSSLIRKNMFWSDLENHEIFNVISRTPRSILDISEQLNKTDITLDYILESIKKDSLNNLIKQSQTLPASNTLEFKFLLLLYTFQSGLSNTDIDIIYKHFQKLLPNQEWRNIISSLIEGNTMIPKSTNISKKNHEEIGYEIGQYALLNIENPKFKDNNNTNTNRNFVLSEAACSSIEMNFLNMTYDFKRISLSYLAVLSVVLIECFKSMRPELQDIPGELSAFCSYGYWEDSLKIMRFKSLKEDIYEKLKKYKYVDLKSFFDAHEENMISLIDEEKLHILVGGKGEEGKGEEGEHSFQYFTILALMLPTILLKISLKIAFAIDLAKQAINIALLYVENEKYRISAIQLIAKLRLFRLSAYLNLRKRIRSDIYHNKIQKKSEKIREFINQLPESPEKNCMDSELKYIVCHIRNKLRKFLPNLSSRKDIKILDECNISKDITNGYVLKGRILSLRLQLCIKHKVNITDKDAMNLRGIIDQIGKVKSQVLKIKLSYLYGKLRLLMAQKKGETMMLSNSINKDDTSQLEAVKQDYLINNGLKIAKNTNYKNYNKKIKEIIDQINLEIRKRCFNIFIAMISNPLVKYNEQNNVYESYDEFDIHNISTFIPDFLTSLSHIGKSFFVKIEALTLQNLNDCFQNGCRVLYLNCGCSEDSHIIIEDNLGQAKKIPFEKIKDMIYSQVNNKKVTTTTTATQQKLPESLALLDIVIIGSSNSEAFAMFLANELRISHVVYFKFEFKSEMLRSKMVFLYRNMRRIYQEKFCEFFYVEIIKNVSIVAAFETAKHKVSEYFATDYFGEKKEEFFGEGAILLSKSPAIHMFDKPFQLKSGNLIDISREKDPSNILTPCLPTIGCNVKIFEIIKELQSKKFIELVGPVGVGKTTIAINLGHYCTARNLYPDGVYYMPCNIFMEQSEIKDFLIGIFGLSIDNNLEGTFTNKSMLFIMDEFDDNALRKLPFMLFLFDTLKRLNISILLIRKSLNNQKITESKLLPYRIPKTTFNLQDFTKIEIDPLTKEQELLLLYTYSNHRFIDFEDFSEKIAKLDYLYRFNGIPGLILNHFEGDIEQEYKENIRKRVYLPCIVEKECIRSKSLSMSGSAGAGNAMKSGLLSTSQEYNILINDHPELKNKGGMAMIVDDPMFDKKNLSYSMIITKPKKDDASSSNKAQHHLLDDGNMTTPPLPLFNVNKPSEEDSLHRTYLSLPLPSLNNKGLGDNRNTNANNNTGKSATRELGHTDYEMNISFSKEDNADLHIEDIDDSATYRVLETGDL